MTTTKDISTFLVNSENLHAEAFQKFGIEYSPDQNIPHEALQMIDCLSRACLPVIGDYCSDAVQLHEAKKKLAESQPDEESKKKTDEESSTSSIEFLQSNLKRLSAQREVDRSVALACQTSNDLLNRGAHFSQKTGTLLAVPNIMSEHLSLLQRIPMVELSRAVGGAPLSLLDIIDDTSPLDEVAKYSIQCSLQSRVFDYRDAGKAISSLSNAASELKAELEKLGSAPCESISGSYLMSIVSHVWDLKKLSEKIFQMCENRENDFTEIGMNALQKCTRTWKMKSSKLAQLNNHIAMEAEQVTQCEMLDTQEELAERVQKLNELSNIEDIEDRIRANFEDIKNSRELQVSSNFFLMYRNLLQKFQAVPIAFPTQRNEMLALFNETLADYELETRMERLEIDFDENRSALEYLASLEFAVDVGKMYETSSFSTENLNDIVEELTTHRIFSAAESASQ